MKVVNIQAAKTHLSRLLEEVASGKEIILAKAGKPVAKLVPIRGERKPRTPGLFKGQGWEAPDAWAPDDHGIAKSIEGPLFHGVAEEEPPAPSKT